MILIYCFVFKDYLCGGSALTMITMTLTVGSMELAMDSSLKRRWKSGGRQLARR